MRMTLRRMTRTWTGKYGLWIRVSFGTKTLYPDQDFQDEKDEQHEVLILA